MSAKTIRPKPASANKAKTASQKSNTKKLSQRQPKDKGLHPNNRHLKGYDFKGLQKVCPKLSHFVRPNPFGNLSIDFADPVAVKALNAALLQLDYDIKAWDIPDGFLCPPVPGRVDYLHYLADLLQLPAKSPKKVRGLDIGTGANGIYPLLGVKGFGWQFVATDIDPVSINNVTKIVSENSLKPEQLSLRLQAEPKHIFHGVINNNEWFDFTMCNPPFHRSLAEASAGSAKKRANLAANRKAKFGQAATKVSKVDNKLNFGGQKAELWCEGGELQFLTNMIAESRDFASQVKWFTSLVSKSENLKPCKLLLAEHKVAQVKVIEMKQGNKITRILAWSFLSANMMQQWQRIRAQG